MAWNIDTTHSSVSFSVRHMVFAKVRGKFAKWTGQLDLDDQDLSKSKVDVTLEAASIDTNEAQRDGHLKSADFLDAEKFPQLTFKSRSVKTDGKDKATVTGDLTIKGVTREVPLQVELSGRGKDPWGNQRVGFTATGTVNRTDFGLKWNQVLEAGGVLVGEKVEIEIELQAVEKKA